jgi:glutathione S-transferase
MTSPPASVVRCRQRCRVLDLYGSGDPATLKLVICLEELGIPFSFHELDLSALAQWSPEHRKLAPQGAVPVLVVDELVMTDASIALLFLAESNPSPKLLPSNLVDRYDVQALNDVVDAAFLDSINLLGWHAQTSAEQRTAYAEALARVPERQTRAGWSAVWKDAETDQLRRAREKIAAGLTKLEFVLAERSWLVAASFSVADINAFALLEGLASIAPAELELLSYPRVMAWIERVRHRAAVRGAFESAARTTAGTRYAPPR